MDIYAHVIPDILAVGSGVVISTSVWIQLRVPENLILLATTRLAHFSASAMQATKKYVNFLLEVLLIYLIASYSG